MFCPDVGMIERLCFLTGKSEHFLNARSVRNVADHFGFRSGTNWFLDLHSHGLEIETRLLADVECDALPRLDHAEEELHSANVIMIEPISLFTVQRQNLLSATGDIIHCLLARSWIRVPTLAPLY